MPGDRLIKPGEAAGILWVDVRTLARWVKEGKLEEVRTAGGQYRYREARIHELAERNALVIDRKRRGLIYRVYIDFGE